MSRLVPLPVGAEVTTRGVRFRVWAPRRRRVDVVIDHRSPIALQSEPGGYFSAEVRGVSAGSRYRFRLDDGESFPDPASRRQPEGPHGPSEVVDPARYRWGDDQWRGLPADGNIVYELHIGTFTDAGTWASATEQLASLARLGVTVIEMMPVHQFPGRFGWGYDGVGWFAPTHQYGTPDDLRCFVDSAHRLGLGVILDVVYNHLGPDGNYLAQFAAEYFSQCHETDWGAAINFDGPHSEAVRELVIANAGYWISEFHCDGLRVDATQDIHDESQPHIIAALAAHARECAGSRRVWIVAENEPQDRRLIDAPERDGYGLDAMWNDDFHHTAMVALSGRREAYYTDYHGSPQELLSSLKWGFLYQGQYYSWQEKARGKPMLDLPHQAMIVFLENHDQVANSLRGERAQRIASASRYRALATLCMLAPATPMLFQGQELGSRAPFCYFADHASELGAKVRAGRGEFLRQFPAMASPESQAVIPDPADPDTFLRSKLERSTDPESVAALAFMTELIALRKGDPAFRAATRRAFDGAVLGAEALLLRYFTVDGADRLLLVNLGRELRLTSVPEPLLAPPTGMHWRCRFSSEDVRYHGSGVPHLDTTRGWCLAAQCATMLTAVPEGAPQ